MTEELQKDLEKRLEAVVYNYVCPGGVNVHMPKQIDGSHLIRQLFYSTPLPSVFCEDHLVKAVLSK